jgi:hypothetical protein
MLSSCTHQTHILVPAKAQLSKLLLYLLLHGVHAQFTWILGFNHIICYHLMRRSGRGTMGYPPLGILVEHWMAPVLTITPLIRYKLVTWNLALFEKYSSRIWYLITCISEKGKSIEGKQLSCDLHIPANLPSIT